MKVMQAWGLQYDLVQILVLLDKQQTLLVLFIGSQDGQMGEQEGGQLGRRTVGAAGGPVVDGWADGVKLHTKNLYMSDT